MKFRLVHAIARANAVKAVQEAPDGHIVSIDEPTRSLDQNAKLHAIVGDLMRAKPEGRELDMDSWKALLMHLTATMTDDPAPFRGRVVQALDGVNTLFMGPKTSRLTRGQFSELIKTAYFYGDQHGVQWSEKEFQVDRG